MGPVLRTRALQRHGSGLFRQLPARDPTPCVALLLFACLILASPHPAASPPPAASGAATGPAAAEEEALLLPLGLSDVEMLLRETHGILAHTSATLSPSDLSRASPTLASAAGGGEAGLARADGVREMESRLDLAADYLEHIAQVSVGEIPYRWISLGKRHVSGGRLDTDTFKAPGPVQGVMAVRFRASRGDVFLIHLTVRDAREESQTYSLSRWAFADLPKREILYLNQPADVSEVVVTMRHDGKHSRRIFVELGVPERPEYARETAFLCRETMRLARRGDLSGAGAALSRAEQRLAEFRASREVVETAVQTHRPRRRPP